MRIIFFLVLVAFGTQTIAGNPKVSKTKVPAATPSKAPAPSKTTAPAKITAPKPIAPAGAPAKQPTKNHAPAAIPATPTTPKAPSAPVPAITNYITTNFINRLPHGAKLPANTPALTFKLTLNGKPTTTIANQDLKTVLTALVALAPLATKNAQAGILIALNYGLLFLNPTGTPGKAPTIKAAVAAFEIAQFIGIKK